MPGIKVKKGNKESVMGMMADKSGRLSLNDSNSPRLEQNLMNESLQVDHPFEKGKKVGWGEYKTMSKLQASKFRDAGITPEVQQRKYDDALAGLDNFPEQAVNKYRDGRVQQRVDLSTKGLDKKPAGRLISGGDAMYPQGSKGIKIKRPSLAMPADATRVSMKPLPSDKPRFVVR